MVENTTHENEGEEALENNTEETAREPVTPEDITTTETTRERPPIGVELSEKQKKAIVDELQKRVDTAVKELKEGTKEELLEFKVGVEESRVRIIETLGIFVALFTFVSVEFQIFRSPLRLLAATGLTLILLGALLLFLMVLHRFLNPEVTFKAWRAFSAYSLLVAGLVCIGIDYGSYKPIYFNECNKDVEYASKACLERLDAFEEKYVKVDEQLVKKLDIGHLERLYKCLKDRRYWQYEQCFIE